MLTRFNAMAANLGKHREKDFLVCLMISRKASKFRRGAKDYPDFKDSLSGFASLCDFAGNNPY